MMEELKHTHIYEWLDHPELLTTEGERKVWEFLNFRTLPAWEQMQDPDRLKGLSVFCEYEGTKYKITGASRMGDIWLATDFEQIHGYDERVMIDLCKNFSFIQL